MDQKKPKWAEQIGSSPFSTQHFTSELQKKIIQKTTVARVQNRISFIITVGAASALICVIAGLLVLGDTKGSFTQLASLLSKASWQNPMRQAYYDHGKLLLEVFPDPGLQAGKSYGYLWSFKAPFDELKGKKLSIKAEHIHSEQKLVAVTPVEITQPSSGYKGLERYTAAFGLPLSGLWRYTAELDGKAYGDVVLSVQEPSWDLTPQFKSGNYALRGIEHKIGFIDAGFIAGVQQKYMWHLWENGQPLEGRFSVKAVKQGDERIIDVFSTEALGGAINGADRTVVTMMSLPEPGLWRLLPYVGDQMLDSIVVRVK
ncbi:DUF4871 domain-containing protein [Paenibacillus sp. RC67]|uniref:DUF4871 domain-containing protein n=1 Tax=Paenibacillus sp. RC67 TaxID=3039392 RepID=UPI0024AC9AB6|nr:DUF4871 domain-containing protein [Paenibacillus sp. RC67]